MRSPLGRDLAERLAVADAPVARRADLLVALVRAAVAAGELDAAEEAVQQARTATAEVIDEALGARLDAVSAEVALDRSHLAAAEELARRAIEGARATDQPAVLCEALLVLGRLLRLTSLDLSGAAFRRPRTWPRAAGLVRWHLRARQELALDAFQTDLGAAPVDP